jgi:hypothetical protein
MLKRDISYEDYNGNQVSDVFYFNFSKPELIEMEVEHKNGLAAMINSIIETKDNKKLIALFKDIVLMAYGQKSDDGKRFIKSDQLREEFSQTAAYSALFMDLATNESAAVDFLKGVLPRDMVGEIDKATKSISGPTPVPNL